MHNYLLDTHKKKIFNIKKDKTIYIQEQSNTLEHFFYLIKH